jgi:DNA mismatch repair protein MutS2
MNSSATTDTHNLLELDRLLSACAREAASDLGRKDISGLRPIKDPGKVRAELARVSEMVRLLETGTLPLEGISDISPILQKIAPTGAVPDRDEYLPLSDFLAACGRVKRYIQNREEPLPELKEITTKLGDFDDLTKQMGAIFDPAGGIRDDASPELNRIRGNIAGE